MLLGFHKGYTVKSARQNTKRKCQLKNNYFIFSSIQCKEEKITETKNIEGESKFSNKNENVESEKSTLADTQCATNTSPNISSQEIMNEKDAKNDVTDLNKIDTNDEQKIKTNR